MNTRTQQFLATAFFGAAVFTAFILAIPQLLVSQPTPAVAVMPTAVDSTPVDVALTTDDAVDMDHWQDTAKNPPTPYIPGKPRKGPK